MSTKTRISLIALLGLPLFAVAPALAGTIATSFGDNFGNNAGVASYFNVCGGQFCDSAGYATPFTPTANYNVFSVDVLMSYEDGDSPYVEIGIYSSVNGAPGALIGELSVLDIANPASTGDTVVYGDNSSTCASTSEPCVYNVPIVDVSGANGLIDGTQYWLAAVPDTLVSNTPTVGADIMWYRNSTSNDSTWQTYALTQSFATNHPSSPNTSWVASNLGSLSNRSAPYFDIIGNQTGGAGIAPGGGIILDSSTPEPATLALLGLGLGIMALRRRQRSR